MPFLRTPSGVSARPQFSQVDFIVYVESDPAANPRYDLDVAFWGKFFALFYPKHTFKMQRLGGKRNVLAQAARIIDNSIANSLCALYRDYDDLLGHSLVDDRIFYTFGYSVENDVTYGASFQTIMDALLPPDGTVDHRTQVESHVYSTLNLFERFIAADVLAAARRSSVIDKRNVGVNLNFGENTLPVHPNTRVLRRRLANGAASRGRVRKAPQMGWQVVHGHLLFLIIQATLSRYARALSRANISMNELRTVVLACVAAAEPFRTTTDQNSYYAGLGRRTLARFIR